MPGRFDRKKWLKKIELEVFPEPEFIRLRHPVLLCHGYGALASLLRPAPLYDVAMWARLHGVLAFAPNIVPYAGIETRATEWKALISQVEKKYGYSRFNIIAHSMGGLDIRYALSKLDIEAHVESYTSVSTPHRGSSLAEFILSAPNAVQERLGDFFDWMGNRVYPKTRSDVANSIKQLTRPYLIDTFNKEITDLNTIPYYSYSAAAGQGTDVPVETVIRFQNRYIFEREGLNDGLVSIESARWGEHIETVPISHLEQMNLRVDKTRIPLVRSFWQNVLKMLEKRGH